MFLLLLTLSKQILAGLAFTLLIVLTIPQVDSESTIFIVDFEHISHLFLVFLLLTLNKQILAGLAFTLLIVLTIPQVDINPFH